jgi:hypothetical protein
MSGRRLLDETLHRRQLSRATKKGWRRHLEAGRR